MMTLKKAMYELLEYYTTEDDLQFILSDEMQTTLDREERHVLESMFLSVMEGTSRNKMFNLSIPSAAYNMFDNICKMYQIYIARNMVNSEFSYKQVENMSNLYNIGATQHFNLDTVSDNTLRWVFKGGQVLKEILEEI